MRATVVAVIALAACPTPYQQDTLLSSGGYQDKQLDDGSYAITVTVNSLTSRDQAVAYLQRRAGELCPTGYDTLDRTSDEGERLVFTRRHPGMVTVPDGTSIEAAIIQCTADAPPPPGRPAAKTTQAVFYCFPGDCTQSRDTCERRRSEAAAEGACAATTAVYCTSFTAVADGTQRRACMPDRQRCKERRDALAGQQAFANVGACYAVLDDRPADDSVAPHGFFCATSPTNPDLGVCDRHQAACTARRAKLGGDLAACAIAPTAQCFLDGDQPFCAPTARACGVTRDRHYDRDAGTGIPVGACAEMH